MTASRSARSGTSCASGRASSPCAAASDGREYFFVYTACSIRQSGAESGFGVPIRGESSAVMHSFSSRMHAATSSFSNRAVTIKPAPGTMHAASPRRGALLTGTRTPNICAASSVSARSARGLWANLRACRPAVRTAIGAETAEKISVVTGSPAALKTVPGALITSASAPQSPSSSSRARTEAKRCCADICVMVIPPSQNIAR